MVSSEPLLLHSDMRKPHPKKEHYEQLMFKTTMAIKSRHYFEAVTLVYALLEDRMVAALKASGGATHKNGQPIKMIGAKIDLLKRRKRHDSLLRAYFDAPLINEIVKWKDRRNALVHAMADGRTSSEQLAKQAYWIAIDGRELVKPVCRAVRRLKKHRHQVPIPP
jgi:hypothetical protein